jgi:hypothetical protein
MNTTHTETNDALSEYYGNKENCFADICAARKAFGSTETTEEQYDQMEKALGIMYLHCPEDIQGAVLATIHEAEVRRLYFNF